MTWKCKECGFEANLDTNLKCEACGYSEATILTLTSETTGKSIEMRIPTTVGKQLLRSFAGDESRFASNVQFQIGRDSTNGTWTVTHDSSAANPTYLDGQPLLRTVSLKDGSVISIGLEKSLLVVRIKS